MIPEIGKEKLEPFSKKMGWSLENKDPPPLDWWAVILQYYGFERDGDPNFVPGLKKEFHAYKRGFFRVVVFCDSSYFFKNNISRWFRIWYKTSSTDVIPLGDVCKRVPIIVDFLQAVQDPDRLPLLMDVEWLTPVIEAYYKDVR